VPYAIAISRRSVWFRATSEPVGWKSKTRIRSSGALGFTEAASNA